MEYALGGKPRKNTNIHRLVLILVVMEYALGEYIGDYIMVMNKRSLNPCCNGICSRRDNNTDGFEDPTEVLILVVMEYALGVLSS